MKTITGDLIELGKAGHFDVIIHGCNCHNQMGAGIAKQIRYNFPNTWMADQLTIPGDKSKLGTITFAREGTLIVVNAYTQYNYTRDKVDVDYDAIRRCMKEIKATHTLFGATLKMRNALYRLKDEPLLADERYKIAQEALNILENDCDEWDNMFAHYLYNIREELEEDV